MMMLEPQFLVLHSYTCTEIATTKVVGMFIQIDLPIILPNAVLYDAERIHPLPINATNYFTKEIK